MFSDGREAPEIGIYPSKTTRINKFDSKIYGFKVCLGRETTLNQGKANVA